MINTVDEQFLQTLLETPSVTGTEDKLASLVRERLAEVADKITTDVMGSVHACLYADVPAASNGEDGVAAQNSIEAADFAAGIKGATDGTTTESSEGDACASQQEAVPTLMLSAHMDEIGLMVTYISDEGFLSVAAVGGVDAAILPGLRVDVHTKEGSLRGVVGRKPIHLISPDERKTVTDIDKLVIDLGLPAQEVKDKVRVGDTISFGVGYERFGKDMAVSRAFDDKAGVWVICRVLELIKAHGGCKVNVVAACTVQEEIGVRGAQTSTFNLNPDVGIAFDVTHATDYPGIEKTKFGSITCGDGPVIARGPNINPAVFKRLCQACDDEGFTYQIEAEPGVTGTDARAIQMERGGRACGLISVPLRYMHTPTEVINLQDLEQCAQLLARFALNLDSACSFVPGFDH